MDLATVGLAIIPPSLALVVEVLNPVSDRLLRRSAETDLTQISSSQPELIDIFAKSMGAVSEVSGLAPTLVSAVTSGFAIIYEVPAPYGNFIAILYTIFFVIITIFILRMLSGVSFFGMADEAYVITWLGKERALKVRRTTIVKRIIYLSNVALIIACISAYLILMSINFHGASADHR